MADIRVPKLNDNDTEYLVVAWLVGDGKPVAAGEAIAVLETSKAADELEAPEAGYLHHAAALDTWVAPGSLLARVTAEAAPPPAPASDAVPGAVPGTSGAVSGLSGAVPGTVSGLSGLSGAAGPAVPGDFWEDGGAGESRDAAGRREAPAVEPVVTDPARAAMDDLGVSEAEIASLGLAVVRRTDVEALAARRADAQAQAGPGGDAQAPTGPRTGSASSETSEISALSGTSAMSEATEATEATGGGAGSQAGTHRLSRVQRAVARAVTVSHDTIPAAYTAVKFDVGPLLERARGLTREVRRPVGLAELFVQAVAALHPAFPLFFSSLDGDRVRPADAPHVGVTFDMGEGLYVPVVHDTSSLKAIADTLMRHRLAAVEGDFRERDLTGATIAVTLHTEADVVLAIPFIFPGTVCALAITSPQREPAFAEDGTVTSRTVACIGLAYDHRLINGRDAALFLAALRMELNA
ncbi:2-oxo acid dehydrogenase subunit E2 [Streptosporangium sp. NPDC050855]|uniref:2-oxo acid dehydrogenase subunit E2 n=1 Tax=Streptosporangium sp. NPDC050855 TaxID=3366194 RepID=UPI003792A0D1